MIPHTIHYCWFGRKPLPRQARKCIASWRRFFPDYDIKEWTEDNFDVRATAYTSEAYERGLYAFVSDYARFAILLRHGGLYFDTDVEVVRPMDDIVARGAFMGFEKDAHTLGVNPGLGMGAEPRDDFCREMVARYEAMPFADAHGRKLPGTVVRHTTDALLAHGLRLEDKLQTVAGITVLPNDYLNPLDDATGRLRLTARTRSIHWYAKTWVVHYGPTRTWLMRRLHRLFGVTALARLKKVIHP